VCRTVPLRLCMEESFFWSASFTEYSVDTGAVTPTVGKVIVEYDFGFDDICGILCKTSKSLILIHQVVLNYNNDVVPIQKHGLIHE